MDVNLPIDLQKERTFPLECLAKECGRKFHYWTMWSMVRHGRVNQFTKKRVKLEAIRMSGGLATSMEAYWRFIERLNDPGESS